MEVIPRGLVAAYAFVMGATVGSFLNVVICRLPEGLSIVSPRSRCPRCESKIAWYDNVPLLSWLILRARCRHCSAPIAFRYFVVELLMAGLSTALWFRFGWSWDLLVWWPLTAALLAITFLDIDEWWVPDVIVFPAMVWVLGAAFIPGGLSPVEALLGLGPALLAFLVAWGFEKVTGREGLGLGDVKLLAVLGLAVGLHNGLGILVLGAVQGAVVGVVVLLFGGHPAPLSNTEGSETKADETASEDAVEDGAAEDAATNEDEDDWVPPPRAIPFGPFLVLGTLEVVLLPEVFANLAQRIVYAFMGMMS